MTDSTTDAPAPLTDGQPALLGPAEIRDLADQLRLHPTKKLGQNFVHDPNTVRRIVTAAGIDATTNVIEVGPGLGSLTLALLGTANHVTAVEIDHRLAQRLPHTVAERAPFQADRLTIIRDDALAITAQRYRQASPHAPEALVANLPYNVAVPVLLHLLAQFPSIRRVLVMVQKEVADRLAANPGGKLYGVPSVKASIYGTVRCAGTIGTAVFWPAPNVDSGLVRIDCFDEDSAPWVVDDELRRRVFPLVDAAFAQRRCRRVRPRL